MLTGGPRFQTEGLPATRHRLALGFAIIAVGMALGRSQVALLLCAFLLAGAAAEIMLAPQPSRYLRQRSGVLTTKQSSRGSFEPAG